MKYLGQCLFDNIKGRDFLEWASECVCCGCSVVLLVVMQLDAAWNRTKQKWSQFDATRCSSKQNDSTERKSQKLFDADWHKIAKQFLSSVLAAVVNYWYDCCIDVAILVVVIINNYCLMGDLNIVLVIMLLLSLLLMLLILLFLLLSLLVLFWWCCFL